MNAYKVRAMGHALILMDPTTVPVLLVTFMMLKEKFVLVCVHIVYSVILLMIHLIFQT